MTRTRTISLCCLALLGLLCLTRWAPTPTAAQEAKPKAPKAAYVGSKKCKKCHLKEFKSWEETPHAKAFEALAPGNGEKVKKAAGLSLTTDYRKDKKCVGCHVVGFGHEGGFELGQDTKKDRKLLLGVGCEQCHGGAKDLLGKGLKDRGYKDAHDARLPKLLEAGYIPEPKEEQCKTCHNDKSPTWTGKFDFEEMKKKGVHDLPSKSK